MSSREPAPMSRAMLRERQARLAEASALADRGDLESAARMVERVLAEEADYAPALALRERLAAAGVSRTERTTGTGLRAPSPDPSNSSKATLPGTNVSAGSWAQFQRRMQLRRETTCLAALRRAMDAGDYRLAHERAIELASIDPSWNEVKLFLEDVLANAGSASDSRPSRVEQAVPDAAAAGTVPSTVQAARQPETALDRALLQPPELEARLAEEPIEQVRLHPMVAEVADADPRLARASLEPTAAKSTEPVTLAARGGQRAAQSPSRRRLAAVALILLFATFAGWAIARMLPDAVVAGWLTALRLASPAPLPSPAVSQQPAPPPIPETELPQFPLGSFDTPLPFPRPTVKENEVSQDRNLADADAGQPARANAPAQPATPQPPQERAPGGPPFSQGAIAAPPARDWSPPAPEGQMRSRSPFVPDAAPQVRAPAGDQNANGDARLPDSRIETAPASTAPTGTTGTTTTTPPAYTPLASGSTAPPPSTSTHPSPSSPAAAGSSPSASPTSPPLSSLPERPGGGTRDATASNSGRTGTAAGARAATGTAEAERQADEGAIRGAIGSYARGYTALDAAAVRRVWPGVNEEALKNAFEQLRAQQIAFIACAVDVSGLHASATCRGTARYVPKVGSGEPISAPHVWQFALRKVVDAWVIESAIIK